MGTELGSSLAIFKDSNPPPTQVQIPLRTPNYPNGLALLRVHVLNLHCCTWIKYSMSQFKNLLTISFYSELIILSLAGIWTHDLTGSKPPCQPLRYDDLITKKNHFSWTQTEIKKVIKIEILPWLLNIHIFDVVDNWEMILRRDICYRFVVIGKENKLK